ncbi:PIG-L deacetylase family protein [Dehalobacterium formicoaceticum]|uniref:PIG-L family deacetylase n=1 Tax=Dehalobacterium formicoaceticum TaxID=51515 RepID=A0ABT1Y5W7_9FIRM|nr:PIG-L family deacetylase [Dehalobacterium formicoaceticum]MCR6546276.1 PIG-L family deacetylase [Dehalobacterium formicoaceticum]
MKTILVIAPHPDDDIIGCGGSMARHIQQGNHVAILYMTSGEDGSMQYSPEELGLIREAEAKSAAAKLGVTDLTFLRCPDGYLEFNKENLDRMVTIIRAIKPSNIYLPNSKDDVPDHQITYRLGLEGCRRAAGPWHQGCGQEPWSVKNILGYEIWTPLQTVGHSEDISEFITAKIEALQLHKSQTRHINYHEAIQGLNRYRGVMTGKGKYCECFQLIRAQICE